jgi:hypothetical protein
MLLRHAIAFVQGQLIIMHLFSCDTESKKKNNGSMKIANKQEMTKNLFHCWTILACGFMTGGIHGCKKEINLLVQLLASLYRNVESNIIEALEFFA